MIKVTVQKNLIALEDLLVGQGTVVQRRGNTDVTVTRINASNFPFDGSTTLGQKLEEIDDQYQYILSNQDKLNAAVNVEQLLEALADDIVALRAWLVNGNVLSAFQPFLKEVTTDVSLANNLNYVTLEETIITGDITIGTGAALYILKGEEFVP